MLVACRLTVVAQPTHERQRPRVPRRDHAPITAGREVLGRTEAERGEIAEVTGPAPAILGTVGLAGVLDHGDAVVASERHQRAHLDGLAPEMDGHDRARPARDRGGHAAGIHQGGLGIHVDEDRRCSDVGDGLGGRDEGEGHGDDLVAEADAGRAERERQRVGSGADRRRLGGAAELREFPLEGFDLRAADVVPGLQHAGGGGQHVCFIGLACNADVGEGDLQCADGLAH